MQRAARVARGQIWSAGGVGCDGRGQRLLPRLLTVVVDGGGGSLARAWSLCGANVGWACVLTTVARPPSDYTRRKMDVAPSLRLRQSGRRLGAGGVGWTCGHGGFDLGFVLGWARSGPEADRGCCTE